MTREEALNKAICVLTYHQVNFCKSKEAIANMNEIIEALEKIDQEPCGDAISRENTLKAMIEQLGIRNEDYLLPAEATLYKVVKNMPPVTPQPKIGRWIEHFDESGKWYECDQCHTDWGGSVNYCPNCGAKM